MAAVNYIVQTAVAAAAFIRFYRDSLCPFPVITTEAVVPALDIDRICQHEHGTLESEGTHDLSGSLRTQNIVLVVIRDCTLDGVTAVNICTL